MRAALKVPWIAEVAAVRISYSVLAGSKIPTIADARVMCSTSQQPTVQSDAMIVRHFQNSL